LETFPKRIYSVHCFSSHCIASATRQIDFIVIVHVFDTLTEHIVQKIQFLYDLSLLPVVDFNAASLALQCLLNL
jgi:hypothetical protein